MKQPEIAAPFIDALCWELPVKTAMGANHEAGRLASFGKELGRSMRTASAAMKNNQFH